MAKNQFLNWGKLPKMQFHEKKKIHLISRVFLPGFFLIFLAHCEVTVQPHVHLFVIVPFFSSIFRYGWDQIKHSPMISYTMLNLTSMKFTKKLCAISLRAVLKGKTTTYNIIIIFCFVGAFFQNSLIKIPFG